MSEPLITCRECGGAMVDDAETSWPYCPRCDWCPDCGTTHLDGYWMGALGCRPPWRQLYDWACECPDWVAS
jgi:hypothetical protein